MFKWIYELKAKLQEKLSEKGQGMTEYAIILAVVAVVAVAVFYGGDGDKDGLEGTIKNAYSNANDAIDKITVENQKAQGGTSNTTEGEQQGNGGQG